MISGFLIGFLCHGVIVYKMKIEAWSGKYFAYFIPSIIVLNFLVDVVSKGLRI